MTKDRFESLRANREIQPILTLDAVTERLSCAVLLDTTQPGCGPSHCEEFGYRMIDELRVQDRIALFNTADITSIFGDITSDLEYKYMLAFKAPDAENLRGRGFRDLVVAKVARVSPRRAPRGRDELVLVGQDTAPRLQ